MGGSGGRAHFRLKILPRCARPSVGRSDRSDPSFFPALRTAGRSVGSFRPDLFFAALRAAGRSVGSDRLNIAQNGDPWVGRSDTQITLSTSRRRTLTGTILLIGILSLYVIFTSLLPNETDWCCHPFSRVSFGVMN